MEIAIRDFHQRNDFDLIRRHDQEMSTTLSAGTPSLPTLEPYNEGWLRRITSPERHPLWRAYTAIEIPIRNRCEIEDDVSRSAVGFAILNLRKNGCFYSPVPAKVPSGDPNNPCLQSGTKIKTGKMKRKRRQRRIFVELFFLSVSNQHRRKGVGRALIDKALKFCKANKALDMRLHVLEGNLSAIRFYQKIGFIKYKLVPDYPQKGYSSWRMCLRAQKFLSSS